jgi:hypothetical protein
MARFKPYTGNRYGRTNMASEDLNASVMYVPDLSDTEADGDDEGSVPVDSLSELIIEGESGEIPSAQPDQEYNIPPIRSPRVYEASPPASPSAAAFNNRDVNEAEIRFEAAIRTGVFNTLLSEVLTGLAAFPSYHVGFGVVTYTEDQLLSKLRRILEILEENK